MNNSILKEMTEADLEMVRKWRNNENVRRFMYTQHEISRDEHLEWWNKITLIDSDFIPLIFEYNNKPCAFVSFSNINKKNKSASWAFYLSEDAKKGISSIVEFKALEYAFRTIFLYKLKCEVIDVNLSVIKMHKKYGFKEEGCFIDDFFNGSSYSTVHHLALFCNEWDFQKEAIQLKLDRVWNK